MLGIIFALAGIYSFFVPMMPGTKGVIQAATFLAVGAVLLQKTLRP